MAQLSRRAGGGVSTSSRSSTTAGTTHTNQPPRDETDDRNNEEDGLAAPRRGGLQHRPQHPSSRSSSSRANNAHATRPATSSWHPSLHRSSHTNINNNFSSRTSSTCISRMSCAVVATSLLASMAMLWSSLGSTEWRNSTRRNRTTTADNYYQNEWPLLLSIDPIPLYSASGMAHKKTPNNNHNGNNNHYNYNVRDAQHASTTDQASLLRLLDITASSGLAVAKAAALSSRFPAVHMSPELPESSLFLEYLDDNDLDWIDNILRPDYGGLKLESKRASRTMADFARSIDATTEYQSGARHRAHTLQIAEDNYVSSRYAAWEDMDYQPGDCVTPLWSVTSHPNCNAVHEYVQLDASPMQPTQTLDTHYLAHGYYRDSFLLNNSQDRVVLKKLRYKHDSDIKMQSKMLTEATIMAALTGSPVTSNLYSHCSTTLIVESAQDFHWDLVPHHPIQEERGRMSHANMRVLEHRYSHGGPFSFNNYTVDQKLQMALEMAEGLAEMHGYVGGVMVNDDVHPEQWLFSEDGRTILNDMNNAVVLEWNFEKQEYCQYYTSYGGDYRAPEEYHENGANVDETVDMWPMGNLIHTLLTGLWPYYELDDEEEIQAATMRGERPYLHPEFRTRSLIERRMTEIMDLCHVLEPQDRVDIFAVVAHLRETKRLAQEEKAKAIRHTNDIIKTANKKAQGNSNGKPTTAHLPAKGDTRNPPTDQEKFLRQIQNHGADRKPVAQPLHKAK